MSKLAGKGVIIFNFALSILATNFPLNNGKAISSQITTKKSALEIPIFTKAVHFKEGLNDVKCENGFYSLEEKIMTVQSRLLDLAEGVNDRFNGTKVFQEILPAKQVFYIRIANISFGSPDSQKFKVLLTPKTSDFWVPDETAQQPEGHEKKASYKKLTISKTIVLMDYGRIKAVLVKDAMQIGSMSGQNFQPVFGAAIQIPRIYFHKKNLMSLVDGVLGLSPYYFKEVPTSSFNGDDKSNKTEMKFKPFLDQFEKKMVTIWQEPNQLEGVSYYNTNGSITFGDTRNEKCREHKQLEFLEAQLQSMPEKPVNISDDEFLYDIQKAYATVSIQALRFNDAQEDEKSIKFGNEMKIALTDNFGLFTSYETAETIAKWFEGKRVDEHMYRIDCAWRDKAPPLVLCLNNYNPRGTCRQKLVINKYIVKMSENTCILPIFGLYSKKDRQDTPIILGIQLLQNKCLMIDYDMGVIGFADGKK